MAQSDSGCSKEDKTTTKINGFLSEIERLRSRLEDETQRVQYLESLIDKAHAQAFDQVEKVPRFK